MTAGFVAVELVARAGDGKLVPDVEDADDLRAMATHEDAIGVWHLQKGQHVVTLRRIGTYSGSLIFEGATSTDQSWNALKTRLGAKLFTYVEAKDRPAAQLTWLQGLGYLPVRSYAEGAGPVPASDPIEAVLPRHVIAGQSAIAVAVPAPDPARVYYPSEWSP